MWIADLQGTDMKRLFPEAYKVNALTCQCERLFRDGPVKTWDNSGSRYVHMDVGFSM